MMHHSNSRYICKSYDQKRSNNGGMSLRPSRSAWQNSKWRLLKNVAVWAPNVASV